MWNVWPALRKNEMAREYAGDIGQKQAYLKGCVL